MQNLHNVLQNEAEEEVENLHKFPSRTYIKSPVQIYLLQTVRSVYFTSRTVQGYIHYLFTADVFGGPVFWWHHDVTTNTPI